MKHTNIPKVEILNYTLELIENGEYIKRDNLFRNVEPENIKSSSNAILYIIIGVLLIVLIIV